MRQLIDQSGQKIVQQSFTTERVVQMRMKKWSLKYRYHTHSEIIKAAAHSKSLKAAGMPFGARFLHCRRDILHHGAQMKLKFECFFYILTPSALV